MPYLPQFANRWIDDWNTRDLERILVHYTYDVVLNSPYAKLYSAKGCLGGKDSLRSYWREGFRCRPNFNIEMLEVFAGHEAATILYRDERLNRVAETFVFDATGRTKITTACYSS